MTLAHRPDNTSAKKPDQVLAVRQARTGEADFVPHLRIDEVQQLAREADTASRRGKGERDSLLIQTIFDGCFRVSEALSLTPSSLTQTPHGWVARITGKGNKVAEVALSPSLASKLLAYAYNHRIEREERLFRFCRKSWCVDDLGARRGEFPDTESQKAQR